MSSVILLLGLLIFVCVSSVVPSAHDQIRIVGGTVSAQGKWPFFAGIIYDSAVHGFEPSCGGAVWDKDTVITAAHCLLTREYTEPELFEIYLGHNKWTGQIDKTYLFKAKEIIGHPDYRKGAHKDDIALIRLDRSIDFDEINSKVECACDPEPFNLLDTSKCVAMGWGSDENNMIPDSLLEVVIPILDNAICAGASSNFNPASHFCAGYMNEGTCDGDSGGPLVCPQKADPNKFALVGVVSFGGAPCGRKPSYFTKVENYLEWIAQVTVPVPTEAPAEPTFWQKVKGWFVGKVKHDELRK